MRYIYLLLVTFIFASCGNQKMRFVRTKTNKQKVVQIADIPSNKKKSKTIVTLEEKTNSTNYETEHVNTITNESDVSTEIESEFDIYTANSLPKSVDDSTTVSAEEAQEIKQEAIQAEKDGTYSLLFSILFYAFLIALIVFVVIAFSQQSAALGIIGIIVSSILSIVSLILGFVFGIKSLRAQYTTSKGKRRALAGIIISSIAFLLLSLIVFNAFI